MYSSRGLPTRALRHMRVADFTGSLRHDTLALGPSTAVIARPPAATLFGFSFPGLPILSWLLGRAAPD